MKVMLFDTETTGLVKNRTLNLDQQPEVIEFYGCYADLKTGKVMKEFGTLIKPSTPLSDTPLPGDKKTITQMTGITNEMLADAPAFAKVAKKIFAMVEGAPVTIAHNHSFDQEMLDIEAERLGTKIKWPRVICTVEQTVAMKGYRLNMTGLYDELFKEKFAGAHRSKVDVMALLRCAVELYKRDII